MVSLYYNRTQVNWILVLAPEFTRIGFTKVADVIGDSRSGHPFGVVIFAEPSWVLWVV